MTNAPRSVSAPTFGDNMKGLDTFSTGYAAAEAKYMTELSATQQKLEAAEKLHADEQDMRIAEEKLRRAAEARIKASQEQEPVGVVRMTSPPDGHAKPIPKWDMSALDRIVDVLKDGDKLYAAPVIPPDVAELQRENAELTRRINELESEK